MIPAAIRTRQRQSIKVMRHSPWADSSSFGNSAWFGILKPQYPAEDELKLNPLKRFANSASETLAYRSRAELSGILAASGPSRQAAPVLPVMASERSAYIPE